MSTTAGAARSDSLKVLDDAAKTGGDSVSPNVRQSAALNSPESNLAVKQMTSDKGSTMKPFVGANGDCSIADSTKPAAPEQQTAQASQPVTSEIKLQTTVGNDAFRVAQN